jgi:hypothetical protein
VWSTARAGSIDLNRYHLALGPEASTESECSGSEAPVFEYTLADLIRDDGQICAVAEIHSLNLAQDRRLYKRAAAGLGSQFVRRVCSDALDARGRPRRSLATAFPHAIAGMLILDGIYALDADAHAPFLCNHFARVLVSAVMRPMDVLFIRAELDEVSFWTEAVGARVVGGFVAVSGSSPLPAYPQASVRSTIRAHQ